MAGPPLIQRLDELERRLDRLERLVRERLGAEAGPSGASAPLVEPLPATPLGAPSQFLPGDAAVEGHAQRANELSGVTASAAAAAVPTTTTGTVPPPIVALPPVFSKEPAKPRASLESIVGGRGLAIAGAAALILGVGFLVTLAVRDGWFGRLPPLVKCGSGAVLGLALLVGGTVVQRRVSRWAASGLLAAGLGALYVSAWAAWALYGLVPPIGAFVMLATTAGVGVLIAARSRLVEVAVVSLAGGYLAPLLVGQRDASPLVMPAHLVTMLVVGLTLSLRLGGAFTALRTLCLFATLVMGSAWLLLLDSASAVVGVGFLGAAWGAFHAEMILSSRRDDRRTPRPEPVDGDNATPIAWTGVLDQVTAMAVVSSFVLTAWAGGLGVWTIGRAGSLADWAITGALGVAAMLVSMVLAGHLRFLIDRPGSRQEVLGAALAAQAGGLVAGTIALGIGGWMQLCAWSAVGASAAIAAGWLRSRPLGWYAACLLLAATVRLVGFESRDPTITTAGVDFFGLWLTRWALLAGTVGGAWALLVALTETRNLGRGLGTLATIMLVAACLLVPVHLDAEPSSVCGAWAAMGLAGVVWSGLRWRTSAMAAGVMCLGFGSVGLLFLGVGGATAVPGVGVGGLVITKWTGMALACGLAWGVVAHVSARRRTRDGRVGSALAMGVATAAFMLAPLDARADWAWVSGAWLLIGLFGAGAHPLVRHLLAARWGGLPVGGAIAAWVWAFVAKGDWGAHGSRLGVHPGLLMGGVASAGVLAWAWWLARWEVEFARRGRWNDVARWAATGVAFIATSHEAARAGRVLASEPSAQDAVLTVWWGVFAIVMLVVGFARGSAAARWGGLVVLAGAAAKAVLYDMAGVALAWRVVVFMVLGAIMLGVALVYARLERGRPPAGGENP